MDPPMISMRLLHIVFGVFWAGSALFLVFFLEPKLRALGPSIQGPVMSSLMPTLTPVFTISALVVIGTGVFIALDLRSIDTLFVNDWGWALLVSLIATVAAISVGLGLTSRTGMEMMKLGQSIAGRPPTPEEGAQLGKMSHQVEVYSRVGVALLLVAVVSMAAARFL